MKLNSLEAAYWSDVIRQKDIKRKENNMKCNTCGDFLFGCPDCKSFASIAAAIRNCKQNEQDHIANGALEELSRIMNRKLVFCATASAGKLEYSIIEPQFED